MLTPKIVESFPICTDLSGSVAQRARAEWLQESLHTLAHRDTDTYTEAVARFLGIPPEEACLGIRAVTHTALFAGCLQLANDHSSFPQTF